jgi:hypothetical protein
MVALLEAHQQLHHEQCGQRTRLIVGQRYIICPCWRPLNPPGSVFVPRHAWKDGTWRCYNMQHRWDCDDMNQLRQGWAGRIITAQSVSTSGRSIWAENNNGRRGLCVNQQFLQPTDLMDLHYLIESMGHPATLNADGEETCPADARTITVRVASYEEARVRLNAIFAADLNAWGNRESIICCLSGS